jgi:hypothetical protein
MKRRVDAKILSSLQGVTTLMPLFVRRWHALRIVRWQNLAESAAVKKEPSNEHNKTKTAREVLE